MNNNYELRPNFECLLVGRQLSNNHYETTLSHQLGKYLSLFQRLCNLCIDCRERKTVRWDLPNIFQLQLSWVMEFTRLNDQTIKLIMLSDDLSKERVFADFSKRIGQTYQRYCQNRISLSEKSRSFKAYTFVLQIRDMLKDSQYLELLSFLKEIIEEEIEQAFIQDPPPTIENKQPSPKANPMTNSTYKPKVQAQRIVVNIKPPPPKKDLGVHTLTQFLENTNRDDCLVYERNFVKLMAFQCKNREVLQKRLLDDCMSRNQEIYNSVTQWIRENPPKFKNNLQKLNMHKVVLPTLYETNRIKLRDPQPTSTRIRSQNDIIVEGIPRVSKIITERSQSLAPSQQRNISQIIETDPESQPHRLKLIRQRLRPFEIYYERLKSRINKQSSSQIF